MDKIFLDLNISIVLYNNTVDELTKLLNSLKNSLCKVYIIDNSHSNKLSIIANSYPFVTYIFNNENLGYGKAHNIAIRNSISERRKYHIVLNPDIIFSAGVINELINYMNSNPDVGLCMPNIVYPNLERQHLCKLLPSPTDLIFRRFFPIKSLMKKHDIRFELQNANYNCDFNAPSLSGCFMFLRTDILEKIGGFDERFFMYCEDLDLCRRINSCSKTMFVPTIPVIHYYNKESYRYNKLLFYHIKSAILYFNKWGWIFDSERRIINKKTLKQLKL